MPGAIHKIPDPNNVVIRAVAQQIQRKRKLDEKARDEEEAREMEKKRKDEERKRNQELQSKSLAAVKEELAKLNHKLNSLKEEKHGLFSELKKVVSREEEEKKRTEVSLHQMFNPGGHISGMFQTAHNHNQYGPNGRISILGSRKDNHYPVPPSCTDPANTKFPSGRMLTPSSPGANPYLRANPNMPSRYLKMPQSPASPAHSANVPHS